MLRTFMKDEIRKLNFYFDGVMGYHVILTHETGQEVAEIVAHSKRRQFSAIDSDAKMDRAVVLAVERMKAQMSRYKKKLLRNRYLQVDGALKASLGEGGLS